MGCCGDKNADKSLQDGKDKTPTNPTPAASKVEKSVAVPPAASVAPGPKPLDKADIHTKVMAQLAPYKVSLTAGEKYYYCTCGRSTNQPSCDGKHAGTDFTPLHFIPKETKDYYLCGCRATKKEAECDGAHQNLKW